MKLYSYKELAIFPKGILIPPEDWTKEHFNIIHWTRLSHGGHFTAMEAPELFANDLRAFFRLLKHGPSCIKIPLYVRLESI